MCSEEGCRGGSEVLSGAAVQVAFVLVKDTISLVGMALVGMALVWVALVWVALVGVALVGVALVGVALQGRRDCWWPAMTATIRVHGGRTCFAL